MTDEDKRLFDEAAYKLAVSIRRTGGDPAPTFDAALKREQQQFRERRDAPIPRYRPPIQREGQWNKHYNDALADIWYLQSKGTRDGSAIKYTIQKKYGFPDYNYHEMIDGSSNCDWQKHKAYKLPPP
jgi:hypothetical protein